MIFGPNNIGDPVPKGHEFEEILWWDYDSGEEIEERKQYRAFEYIDGSGDYVCVKFHEEAGKVSLHYVNKLYSRDIPISFDEYVRLIFTSYGVVSRHELSKPEFYKDPYLAQPELVNLKDLLPMTDFDDLIKDLQAKYTFDSARLIVTKS